MYFVKFVFDCTFHIVVIIIMINILFGIIIDTFAQLRDEKQTKDDDKRNVCYICNIDRNTVSTSLYLITLSSTNIQMDSRSTSPEITTCGPMSSISSIYRARTLPTTRVLSPTSMTCMRAAIFHGYLSWRPFALRALSTRRAVATKRPLPKVNDTHVLYSNAIYVFIRLFSCN